MRSAMLLLVSGVLLVVAGCGLGVALWLGVWAGVAVASVLAGAALILGGLLGVNVDERRQRR
jgi:hypothetical protein